MNGFDTYKLHHAILLHFTTDSYDFFKYHGKTKVTVNTWNGRNDKFHFETMGKKYNEQELIGIFVSYHVQDTGPKQMHGKALLDHSRTKYIKWQRDIQAMPNTFEQDMYYLKNYAKENVSKLSKMFKVNGSPHPPFIELIMNGSITYESALIFDKLTGVLDKINDKIEEDIIWPDIYRLLIKYRPFLQADKKKYKKILNKVFE